MKLKTPSLYRGIKVWTCMMLMMMLFSQCSVKKIVYFNDLPTDTIRILKEASAYQDPLVQPDDILNITIQTLDPTTSSVVNQAVSAQLFGSNTATGGSSVPVTGFRVDKDGNIQMALLGRIPVKGMTTSAIRDLILAKALKYYKDPTVEVRFANFKITVLGEVNRPATYAVTSEKVSVLDALGLAGDMTIYGRRENILLVRESAGQQKEFVRLNMNDSDIFRSPYFYLKQNDVIYIEPSKAKAGATDTTRTQNVGIFVSIVSLLTVVLTRVF